MDLSKLNKNQLKAVTHDKGPVILVAGAGTGKTTVITNRIAWLIENKLAKPDEIVALTFTDKASTEMEERVDKLLPLGYVDLWVQTFHAFADRILNLHGLDIGLPIDYKVLDQTSAWMLVRENLDKFALDYYRPLGNPTRFIHALINHFSRCKDETVYPEDYLKYAEGLKLDNDQTGDREAFEQEITRLNELAGAYHTYQQLLLENNALDFGDLMNYCHKLFKERPKILQIYREQFKYILVDEFQDTNWAQYELVKMLVGADHNIMVVGDDDQAIYKFRGASVSNILAFKKDFPTAKEIYLTDNYRSGQAILDKAYEFIQLNNPDRLEVKLRKTKSPATHNKSYEGGIPPGGGGEVRGPKSEVRSQQSAGKNSDQGLSKKLISHAADPGQLEVLKFATKEDEIRGVLERILELKKNSPDFSWEQVAILSRSNDEAQRFVRLLRAVGLPHQFVASKGLYTQEIIMNILAYLKLLDNYHESPSLYRILSLQFFGLSHEDIVNLNHLANQKSWSLYFALKNYHGQTELTDKGAKGVAKLLNLLDKHKQLAERQPVSAIIYQFLEDSGYLELLTLEDSAVNHEQLLYLNQFYRKVRQWEEENIGHGIHNFTESINLELESGEAGTLDLAIEEGPETIKVMTIHGAKGLEFKYVFIVGLVHLKFPSIERSDPIELPAPLIKDTLPEGDSHLQEERRLMYVALTRAKNKVFLTMAEDYGGAKKRKPSRFLEELKLLPEGTAAANQDLVVSQEERPLQATSYKLPAKLSFTQLKAFDTCPYQYYYAHVIKIPSKGSAVFSFGQTMHKVLQKFFQLVIDRSKGVQASLFGAEQTGESKIAPTGKELVSLKELLQIYEEVWQDDWFFSPTNKENYKKKGDKILKEFYTKIKTKD